MHYWINLHNSSVDTMRHKGRRGGPDSQSSVKGRLLAFERRAVILACRLTHISNAEASLSAMGASLSTNLTASNMANTP